MKTIKVLLLLICGVGAFAICFRSPNVLGQQEQTPNATQKQAEVQAPAKRSSAATGQMRKVSSTERNKKMIEARLTRLDKYLKLSPGQKKDIRNLIEKSQPEIHKIEEQMKQLQEQMRKIIQRTDEEIKPFLTSEQKKKYEILQEVSPEMGGPGEEMGGPGEEMWGSEER